MSVRVVKVIALGVTVGMLATKVIEAGGRMAVEKGKEVLDKRIRKVAKEDKEY